MTSTVPHNVWNLAAELGEGPVWAKSALWFVDIKRHCVHRFDPADGAKQSWDAPQQIGFILPTQGGSFIAGLQDGLHRFDEADGSFTPLVEVEPDQPENRLNDGVVDPAGRLWFGTMDDRERRKEGAFYCYQKGRLSRSAITGIAITNGPAISPVGDILYWVDTLAQTIWACALGTDGSLGPSERFATIAPGEGYPDGPTVDSEGCVWISLYAGWEVRRYSPRGELLERVRFPVANITKIAFGGPRLTTAFATTARQKMTPDEIAPQPEIGDLFTFDVDVPGLPCPLIAE